MMNIAILGFGNQGLSAYKYWKNQGHRITICDKNEDLALPEGAIGKLGKGYLHNLNEFHLIVRSPSIHSTQIAETNELTILSKVTTVTNEFFRVCPTKNIIGITGTKGKGTTSTLVTKMLEAAGKRVHLGGNIGTPPLDLLAENIQPEDWVVLELANFQLLDLKDSPYIAVCLMVESEHQDWHGGMEDYITAKQQLFIHQLREDIAIFYSPNEYSRLVASVSAAKHVPYMASPGAVVVGDQIQIAGQTICSVDEIQLLGKHNWQNICAAATAVWQVEQNIDAIRLVATTLQNLPYRIELRREVKGIKFYNDSFSSAPPAAEAAIEAVPEKKVLILGGYDRGLSLDKLTDTLNRCSEDIRKVIIIGAVADRLQEVFDSKGFSNYIHEPSKDMSVIVKRAMEFAQEGDAVVLSPGFASFDMFKNFEVRGLHFNKVVAELELAQNPSLP